VKKAKRDPIVAARIAILLAGLGVGVVLMWLAEAWQELERARRCEVETDEELGRMLGNVLLLLREAAGEKRARAPEPPA
jgi:hypothetical protein